MYEGWFQENFRMQACLPRADHPLNIKAVAILRSMIQQSSSWRSLWSHFHSWPFLLLYLLSTNNTPVFLLMALFLH